MSTEQDLTRKVRRGDRERRRDFMSMSTARRAFARAACPAVAVGFALCLAGCPPIYNATFCNAAGEPLTVSIREAGDAPDAPARQRVVVPPGEQRPLSFPAWCQQVEVSNHSGVPLWRREVDYGRKGGEQDRKPGHPTRHHLLTASGIYVVPGEYSSRWRDHVDQIVLEALALPVCTQDSYPYNVGLVPRRRAREPSGEGR